MKNKTRYMKIFGIKKPQISLLYLFRLAFKDLWHNKISTFALISVICFVSLPLLILGTVKDRYITYLIETIERETNAKRIDFYKSLYTTKSPDITLDLLKEISVLPNVHSVIPHITMSVTTISDNGTIRDYTVESTIPNDPELIRENFTGVFQKDDYRAIIINERHKSIFGNVAVNDTIRIFVTRTIADRPERYPITCRVAGFVRSGDARKFRIPLSLAQDLRSWNIGYGVAKLKLPAAPDRENALGAIHYPACRFYPIFELNYSDSTLLRVSELKIEKIKAVGFAEHKKSGYLISKETKKMFIGHEWKEYSRSLSARGTPYIVPVVDSVQCTFLGNSFVMKSTLPDDPIKQDLLDYGRWIAAGENKFQIILPKELWVKTYTLPKTVEITVGDSKIPVTVVGLVKTDEGFASPELVYRLHQTASGAAVFDRTFRNFGPSTLLESDKQYEIARVYAKGIDDVLPLVKRLSEKGFEVRSQQDRIINIKRINKLITNLVVLIGSTGLFAVILATAGILFEAIFRKKRQIAIMRTMGMPRKSLQLLYLTEAFCFGFIGFLMANLFQLLFALIGDSYSAHQVIGLALDQPIFNSSWQLRIILGFCIVFLCLFTGLWPARYASKIEPAIILSERNN